MRFFNKSGNDVAFGSEGRRTNLKEAGMESAKLHAVPSEHSFLGNSRLQHLQSAGLPVAHVNSIPLDLVSVPRV